MSKYRTDSLFEVEESLHILVMNVEALSTTKGADFARKCLSCHKKKKAPMISPGDRTKKA